MCYHCTAPTCPWLSEAEVFRRHSHLIICACNALVCNGNERVKMRPRGRSATHVHPTFTLWLSPGTSRGGTAFVSWISMSPVKLLKRSELNTAGRVVRALKMKSDDIPRAVSIPVGIAIRYAGHSTLWLDFISGTPVLKTFPLVGIIYSTYSVPVCTVVWEITLGLSSALLDRLVNCL